MKLTQEIAGFSRAPEEGHEHRRPAGSAMALTTPQLCRAGRVFAVGSRKDRRRVAFIEKRGHDREARACMISERLTVSSSRSLLPPRYTPVIVCVIVVLSLV